MIQPKAGWSEELDALVRHQGLSGVRRFERLPFRVVELPASAVANLEAHGDVAYVSLNREVRPSGHVSQTSGADAVRNPNGATVAGLDGSGIGIAILDSGMDSSHRAFLNKSNLSRIIVNRDFTGEGRTDDPYGHGTHVASIAGGNGRISNGQYTGVAPNANLINLRVLNSQGTGNVAGLLAALDWVLTNRAAYNIRVVSMSLGGPAIDSYQNDPVCRAVRSLVEAGVVVLAAAGNNGRDVNNNKVYGRVHSPGNEPAAITVGASNSFGTDARGDDVVTSYSSRGPTRSYWTDSDGVRHYDNLIKPDLVAPGNKLIYAQAVNNHLVANNPALDAGVSPVDGRKMMYLNGSSMATPVAAGAAALLLQANPSLTPSLVKMLLTYTAQPLAGFNMFEQGAGQVNVEGAVRLARLVRTDLTAATPLGDPLLTAAEAPAPQTTIAGHTFTWAQGCILNHTYASGGDLITKYQKVYGAGFLLGSGVIIGDTHLTVDQAMMSSGVIIGDHVLTSGGVIIGDGVPFLAVAQLLGDGVIIGDGAIVDDGVIIGDGGVKADATMQAQSATVHGDDTPSMGVAVDDGVDYLDY